MSFNDRLYEDFDFCFVEKWWQEWGKRGPKKLWLPKTGCVVEWNGIPIAMTWLWMDPTSKLAQMAFSVTDPKTPVRKRIGALVRTFAFLEIEAKRLELDTLHGICGDTTLAKVAIHRGFNIDGKHYTCFKELGE